MKKTLHRILVSAIGIAMLTCCVSIVDAASINPTLSKHHGTFLMGQSKVIKVRNTTPGYKVKFKSGKPSIATVSRKGRVTAIRPGTTKITVTVKKGNKKKLLQYRVKVRKPRITESLDMYVGDTEELSITNAPTPAAEAEFYWTTDDQDIATVEDGIVNAVGEGTAIIRLKIKTAKATVTSTAEVNVSGPSGPNPGDVEVYTDNDDFAKAGAELVKNGPEANSATHALDGDFTSSRLIVKSESNLDVAELNTQSAIFDGDSIWILQFNNPADARNAMKDLSGNGLVEWVEADKRIETESTDAEQEFKSWGVSTIEAEKYAEYLSGQSNSAVVSVIDTGVADHPFLSGRVLSDGFDFVDVDEDPDDEHFHGTHVAGTIVDCTPGLSVNIQPIRVLDEDGSGYNSNVAAGIRYAADHGADVVNLSLGGGHSSYVDEAVSYATDKGVAVVVSAGNENRNTVYSCPAHISKAIVVAAMQEDGKRANFSNYGDSVDVIAPGVKILSSIPGGGYKKLSGTSMAAPHISAAAAMLKIDDPDRSPEVIEQILRDISLDLGEDGWDQFYGSGLPKLSRLVETEPKGITLNVGNDWQNLQVGQTLQLEAQVEPSTANQFVTMESLSPSVIDVDENGLITAKKQGRGQIMVQAVNGFTTYCKCHVTDPRYKEELVVPEITSLETDPYLNAIRINFSEFSIPGDDGHVELRIRSEGKESFIANIFDYDKLTYYLPYYRHGNLIRDGVSPKVGDTVEIGINAYSWTSGHGASRSDILWKSVRIDPPTVPRITTLTHDPNEETLSVRWGKFTECLDPSFSCVDLWARTPDGEEILIDAIQPDTEEYSTRNYTINYKKMSDLLGSGIRFESGETVNIGISYFYAGCDIGGTDIDWRSITLK